MATLNGLYIFVIDEEMTLGVDVNEHAVETGISISDHVKRKAKTLSLSGEIVGENASSTLAKLKNIHQTGVVCKYNGRNSFTNCLITEFSTSHPNNIWGGCSFSMTLKEIRTAKTSYIATTAKKTKTTTKTGTQQTTAKSKVTYVYHTVKKGDTVWALVASSKAPYKKYGLSCDDVMKLNPNAFSRKGDFGTLKIGYKLIVGKR